MSANARTLKDAVFLDLEREIAVTRRVLEALPKSQFAWKPHAKSMSLGELAIHVADMPGWIRATLAADELDAASAPRPPKDGVDRAGLLARWDANVAQMRAAVAAFDMANWERDWTMRSGAAVIVARPRPVVYRVWSLNHMIHHRAQLCVYLRLLGVAVPTVYFNTADDERWVFE
jgi:uncharacterized damage-inducible protein DinB